MPYSREYFRLNFLFAERAAELASIPLPEALFRYTHLYRAMRMGTTPNSANPDWQAYLAGLADAEDPPGWTHAFCEERHARLPPRILENASGCFSFELWEDGRVRLHFRNAESPGVSPLCRERMPVRRAELADLFSHLRHTLPGDARVVGGSWMYHLEAYRRLFPLRFLQTARFARISSSSPCGGRSWTGTAGCAPARRMRLNATSGRQRNRRICPTVFPSRSCTWRNPSRSFTIILKSRTLEVTDESRFSTLSNRGRFLADA